MSAGVTIPKNLHIPNWLYPEQAKGICDALGLKWLEGCSVSLGVEPVIVVFYTGPQKAHAVFTNDIGHFLDERIIGIVLLR